MLLNEAELTTGMFCGSAAKVASGSHKLDMEFAPGQGRTVRIQLPFKSP